MYSQLFIQLLTLILHGETMVRMVFTAKRVFSALHMYQGATTPRSCPYMRFIALKQPV